MRASGRFSCHLPAAGCCWDAEHPTPDRAGCYLLRASVFLQRTKKKRDKELWMQTKAAQVFSCVSPCRLLNEEGLTSVTRTRGQSHFVPRTRHCNLKQLWLETKILPRKENPRLQFPASALLELYMGRTPCKAAFYAVRGRHIILVSGILLAHLLKMGPLPSRVAFASKPNGGMFDASNSFKLPAGRMLRGPALPPLCHGVVSLGLEGTRI